MTTTIDRAGRVVVPKALREAAQLRPGSTVEVELEQGRIVNVPATMRMRLEERGGVKVIVPARPVPRMTSADVEATLEKLRSGRE